MIKTGKRELLDSEKIRINRGLNPDSNGLVWMDVIRQVFDATYTKEEN